MEFFNKLCRRIDIKKKLYKAYNSTKVLEASTEELLGNDAWSMVIYLLAHQVMTSNNVGLQYKAINTALKAKALLPESCLNDGSVQKFYRNIEAYL